MMENLSVSYLIISFFATLTKSNEIFWLSHLPLELWVDIFSFPWISREEMGKIVNRFRNRKFAEYLQFFLHDWGKSTLKPIYFNQQKARKNKCVHTSGERPFMGIPETPMPNNIKCFEYIQISHFDQIAINFLRQIQPLLADIKLQFCGIQPANLESLRTILAILLPLMDGIYSLHCNVHALPTVRHCFAADRLARLKELKITYEGNGGMDEAVRQTTVSFLMDCFWLNNIGPKWCELTLSNDNNGFIAQIAAAIREEFLASNNPSTFSICVIVVRAHQREFAEFHLTNNIGEELHGVKIAAGYFHRIQITRHQADCGTQLKGNKSIDYQHCRPKAN